MNTSTTKAALKWLGHYALFMGWLWVTANLASWGIEKPLAQWMMYFCGWTFGSLGAFGFYIERQRLERVNEKMTKPDPCQHLNFNGFANVGRVSRGEGDPEVIVCYTVELKVSCRDCGQKLEFVGLPWGMSFYKPTVSIDGSEARLPMVIPGQKVPPGMLGYGVSFKESEPEKDTLQ